MVTQFVMIGFSIQSQKQKHIVLNEGIKQVATVSFNGLVVLCDVGREFEKHKTKSDLMCVHTERQVDNSR